MRIHRRFKYLMSIVSVVKVIILSSCLGTGSEADQLLGLAVGIPVPVGQDLQITFSTPSANTKVGYTVTAGGSCTLAGATVKVIGPAQTVGGTPPLLGYTACQAGGTWSVDLDFSLITTQGSLTVSAYLINGTQSSNAATQVFVKDNTDCDTAAARNDRYGNYSTGGDGGATPYTICNASQFSNIRLDLAKNYILKNDIDFGGAGLTVIGGTYIGTLNGNSYTIRNLSVSSPGSNQVGIFSYLGNGTSVSDLTIEGLSVVGNAIIGGLAGRIATSSTVTISNVTIKASSTQQSTVTGLTGGAGGIFGYLDSSSTLTMTNVSFTGTVTGVGNSGGILGYSSATATSFSLTNATTAGSIVSTGSNAGGIAGNLAFTSSTFNQLTSTMNITTSGTSQSVGGLVGTMAGGTINTCSYNGTLSIFGQYAGGIVGNFSGTTIADCSVTTTITGDTTNANINYVGGIMGYSNTGTTVFTNDTANVTINITGVNLGQYVGGLAGRFRGLTVSNSSSQGTINVNTGDGTTTGGTVYGGGFGQVYTGVGETTTVSNSHSSVALTIVSSVNAVYTGGLMGQLTSIDGGPAASVTLANVYATGNVTSSNQNVGGLIGYSYVSNTGSTTTLTNVYATGNVTATQQGTGRTVGYVGGLIGQATTRNAGADATPPGGYTINGAYATGAVTSQGPYTGGLIGFFYTGRAVASGSSSSLTNAYATGNVIVTYNNTATNYVGGLIGRAYPDTLGSTMSISNSYATGTVTNQNTSYTGGLIGEATTIGTGSITLSNIHATGSVTTSVTTTVSDSTIGGLIGRTGTTGVSVTDAYATGQVKVDIQGAGSVTNAYAGGLIGYNLGPLTKAYATGNVLVSGAGTRVYVGGLVGRNNDTITNSLATGSVVGGQAIGGFVGYHRTGTISNAFSAGHVTAAQYGGGFIGDLGAGGSAGMISKVYAIGSITRDSGSSQTNRFGQIIGYCGNNSYLSSGYYNSTTSIVDSAITTPETNCNSGYGLTPAQMIVSTNYSGWDFVGSTASSWRYSGSFVRPGDVTLYPYPVLYWFSLLYP